MSEICQFYQSSKIFITGGTGFLGKILIEKLLRSTDVALIYILIREKKEKCAEQRLVEMFDDVIFERLKLEKPKFYERIIAINGDCMMAGLGLNQADRGRLIDEIEIVFHVAATVRFDENIKTAYAINVDGVRGVLEMGKQMKNLKVLMHVSTAYSHCHLSEIDEKFYDMPMDYDQINDILQKSTMDEADKMTSRLIGDWPNTYTFTKGLAESLVRQHANGMPIAIFRPAIIVSTYKEPIKGWTDNLYGPAAACIGVGSSLLRVFPCDSRAVADLVPVDTCACALLAAAWETANQNATSPVNLSPPPIYNYVSSVENPVTWTEFITINFIYGLRYPISGVPWTIRFTPVRNRIIYNILRCLLHLIPAILYDTLATLCGQQRKLLTIYRKIHKMADALEYFTTRSWQFKNDHIRELWEKMSDYDRKLFPFSMKEMPWLGYFTEYFKGLRIYRLNDPMETVPTAKARIRRFEFIHNIGVCLIHFMIVWTLWYCFGKFLTIIMPFNSEHTVNALKNHPNNMTATSCNVIL